MEPIDRGDCAGGTTKYCCRSDNSFATQQFYPA